MKTIQAGKLFKEGNYSRKYGMWFHVQLAQKNLNGFKPRNLQGNWETQL